MIAPSPEPRERGPLVPSRALSAALLALALLLPLAACTRPAPPPSESVGAVAEAEGSGGAVAQATPDPTCPDRAAAPTPLPRVEPSQRTVEYWLERQRATHGAVDVPVMTAAQIDNHDASLAETRGESFGLYDLGAPIDEAELRRIVDDRRSWFREKLATGEYSSIDGGPPPASVDVALTASLPPLQPALHLAVGPVPLRCGPFATPLFKSPIDERIDRNQCSTAHRHEPVQVLATWPNGMRLARTTYAIGWIAEDAPLTRPLSAEQSTTLLAEPKRVVLRPDAIASAGGAGVRDHDTLLSCGGGTVGLATEQGARCMPLAEPDRVPALPRPMRRQDILRAAFSYLDEPYGWGGAGGGRDCSRFVLDVFASFGVTLPRFSGWQADAGTFSIDVSGVENEREKLLLIEAAAERGVVLLHFPGHVMLYLGTTESGRPMAIHAFAEYVEPCDEGEGETLRTVAGVEVSDLELGRGSSRGAFIERVTRVVVFGQPPDPALQGIATVRDAAQTPLSEDGECPDGPTRSDAAIFASPATPNAEQPLRVIATSSRSPGAATLRLFAPDGAPVEAQVQTLGGPPYSRWAEVASPQPGVWTALWSDGSEIVECGRIWVRPGRPSERGDADGPVWPVENRWTESVENFYSAWIEQLFDYPADEDLTWNGLQVLLRNEANNLLYDHRSLGEEERFELEPDCADLPYYLRAYFAWKLRLPFGYRHCSRGRANRPPSCGELRTNLTERAATHPADAFYRFARRGVRNGVHSSSNRTTPDDEETDVYPVALTREALRPGTVYADPYGHILVVADWIPQRIHEYGVLIAADAQPDGTVGRRRFWRGSFLFDPDTSSAGAGFKAWRPLEVDEETGELVALSNEALRDRSFAPYSTEQYAGTRDDFYDRMDALINPRPLDPRARLVSLVDALAESVARRVNSVENGEAFMRERNYAPIEMPEGAAIFQTVGPWEDYSTPSRDMRLLISMDTVTGFPGRVERAPGRYGVTEEEAPALVDSLRALMRSEMEAHTFEYVASDGSARTFTLADVVDRAERFEMAYNPNDCVEIRWGEAPESSAYATCDRHAPRAQRARMETYRPWFEERRRP